MRKKHNKISPDAFAKDREALLHKNRKTILFNEKEMSAIREYCKSAKIKNPGVWMRSVIMKAVLEGLDENHPTLF